MKRLVVLMVCVGYLAYCKEKGENLNEPGILEVQEMAIRYSDTNLEKIKNLRKGAKIKSLLPTVKFETGKNSGDYWYSGEYQGDKNTDSWNLSFAWNLSDFIYSNDQTSIDDRSRLMVGLRNDILEKINMLYFERKRLIIDDKEKNAIKIEELTALIDGYTGGGFSKRKNLDKK